MQSTRDNDSNNRGYIEYDPDDMEYFGAAAVIDHEKNHVIKRQGLEHKSDQEKQAYLKTDLSGLALSGGGIRSASFCLGVLQALSYNRWLKQIDYLSSVSGGGYIGSSVNWLLSNKWQNAEVGVDREDFPYGTYPMCGHELMAAVDKPGNVTQRPPRVRGALLRYLRQHGKYLVPGDGIGPLSLAGVVIRGTILSLFVYFSLLVLLFSLVGQTFLFRWVTDFGAVMPIEWLARIPNFSLAIALLLFGVFVIFALVYSVLAFFISQRSRNSGVLTGGVNDRESHQLASVENLSYKLRRFSEHAYTWLLGLAIGFCVIGLVPVVYHSFDANAVRTNDSAGLTGLVSILVGIFSSFSTFLKTSSIKAGKIPLGLLVAISMIALWFGLLLFAYHCSLFLVIGSGWTLILAGLVFMIGWLTNLNYISVHRYYRDRLMEVFMPNLDRVVKPDENPRAASASADKARLSDMCWYTQTDARAHNMPYHIINTNIVLVSSKIAKFRGRGGDNFILTPAYCGSNATGWRKTSAFMENRMTLSTAMAISGAAVNPSTGVGGDGVTRQPFLSMLMGLLNIRLGYWAPNPDPDHQPLMPTPNFIYPGLSEMIMRRNLNEKSRFVQLSDGGHFENLGLYELIRRKVRLIIACDGAADADCKFTDLSNALEKIRADFGVLIDIKAKQLEDMIPSKDDDQDLNAYARRGYLVADILYPDGVPGKLIYIKSSFFGALSADLYGYKQSQSEFPDEPTSDQFFDEKQFEAYRELGYQTAWEMMIDPDVKEEPMISRIFPQLA